MAIKGKYGSGSLYRRGSTWWYKYHKDGEAVRVSLGTTDKSEAERARDSLIQSTNVMPSAVVKLLRHALEEEESNSNRHLLATAWKERPYIHSMRSKDWHPLKPSTVAINRCYWNGFVAFMADEYHKVIYMEDVKECHGDAWVKALQVRGGGPRACHSAMEVAGVMFRLTGLPSPFISVRRPQEVRISRRALTNAEVSRLIEVAAESGAEWKMLFLLAIYTGMRLGDCATLTWESIDLGAGIVSRVTGKTGARVSLPLHPSLRNALSDLPDPGSRSDPLMPEVSRRYSSGTTKPRFFRKLHCMFFRAGIETHANVEGRQKAVSVAGFHALRHSFVSACARAGIPEGVVRQWVGHGSLMVTRLYTHWSAADAAGITRALPDFVQANGTVKK